MRVGLAGLPEVIAPCRIVIPRWRASVLTIALTALTGVVSVAGLISPAVLGALERTPAALHGEAWRWITSLLVQDGGVLGTASNLIFLGHRVARADRPCSQWVSSAARSTALWPGHGLRSGRSERWPRAARSPVS
jgi:hypothetical protein